MRRIVRIFGWFFGILFLLILLVFLLPHIPPVQKRLVIAVKNYYHNKTGEKLELGKIYFWPDGTVIVKHVEIVDEHNKPLIKADEVNADIRIFSLLRGDFILSHAQITSGNVHIERRENGVYNFDFLTEAFASKKTKSNKSTSEFTIEQVFLENTSFTFSDRRSRLYTKAYVKLLQTEFTHFNADEQLFHVNTIDIYGGDGFVVDLAEREVSAMPDDERSSMPDVFFRSVNLYDTRYLVYMKKDGLSVSSYAGELHATTKEFSLNNSLLYFDNITMRNSGSAVKQRDSDDEGLIKNKIDSESPEWIVKANNIEFSNTWFTYDHPDEPLKNSGFDPSHMRLSHVNIKGRNIVNMGAGVKGMIESGSLVSAPSYRIKSLSGQFDISGKSINANNFRLITSYSNLTGNFITRQNGYASFSKEPEKVKYFANLSLSAVSVKDIIYFAPQLDTISFFKRYGNLKVGVQGIAEGTLASMRLNNFTTSAYGSSVMLTGRVMNIDSTEKFAYDIPYLKARINASAVDKLLPDTILPERIVLPEITTITGTGSGNISSHSFDLAITTSEGSIKTKGSVTVNGPLDLTAELDTLNLGKITSVKSIGKISGNITATLTGTNLDSAVGRIIADLSSAYVKGYRYTGVYADLTLNNGTIGFKSNLSDPAAKLVAEGAGSLSGNTLSFGLTADIDTLDLYRLGLSNDTLSFKGHSEFAYNGSGLDDFDASGKASNLYIKKDELAVHPDSMLFSISSRAENLSLNLQSSIADAAIKGNGKLSTLTDDIRYYVNSYFTMDTSATDSTDLNHQLSFNINIKDPAQIAPLLEPSLVLSPLEIDGSYNGRAKELKLSTDIRYLQFRGNTIDSIKFNVDGNKEKLTASISAPDVVSKGMLFPNPALTLTVRNDSLYYSGSVRGSDGVQRLKLGGLLERIDEGYALSVSPGEFILNNKSWDVNPGNKIIFDSSGVSVKGFRISHGDQALMIDQSKDDELVFSSRNFELMDLSMIPDSNRYLAGGKLSGDLSLPLDGDTSELSGNFTLKDFNFRKDTMGDIAVSLSKQGPHKLGIETTLSGRGNSLKAEGVYDFADIYTPFDFRLNITQINFETLQPYLGPVFEKMTGYAKANLTLRGNKTWPLIDGDLLITDASLLPKYTNSWVHIKDQPVKVDQSSFMFTNFLMTDSLKDPALINGYICPEGLPHISFDLLLVTSNFMILNTQEGDNEQYFGRAYVTSVSKVTGDDINPNVNINAKLEKGSRITLLVPEQKIRESNSDDVVQFINLRTDSVKNQITQKRVEPSFAGVTLNSNIEVDENSQFKLLIDPQAGDSLSVKGKTTFSFGVDPGGKMTMTGVYEVTEGSYLLTLTKGLKRRFDIIRGSLISWAGNPLNPTLTVSAKYTVRAAPYDLVVNDIAALADNTAASYRQEMPFEVNLKMNGPLKAPAVLFNVQLPDDQQGALEGTVYARLNQLNQNESELNTQVFSLLVLNRFFNNQEILNSGGPLFSAYARTGASRIVSQRLNSFATTYANFVELQMDVDFYETFNGTTIENTTNMRLGVGRKFFGERLDLRTGGQVVLQGSSQFQNNNDFPSVVTAEYKLTRDGRYRLSGFRKNTYEGVFEGQIIREGAGIVFIREFNKFREMFRRPEERDLLDAAPKPKQ